jgi:lipid-A-disaccharide synthase
VAKALIRTRYITLFNVAAGAFVAPERVQEACRGDILAADLARLLDDAAVREAQVAAQTAALELMRGGIADPIAAAADAVTDAILSRESR